MQCSARSGPAQLVAGVASDGALLLAPPPEAASSSASPGRRLPDVPDVSGRGLLDLATFADFSEQLLAERTRLEQGALETVEALEAAMQRQHERAVVLESALREECQGQLQEEASLARLESVSLAATCREAAELRLELRDLRASAGHASDSLRQEAWEAREEGRQEREAWRLHAERLETEAGRSSGALETRLELLEQQQAAQRRDDQQQCDRLEAQAAEGWARVSTLHREGEDLRARVQGHERRERDLEATCQNFWQKLEAVCMDLEAARRDAGATPALGDEGALLRREFELQVEALQGSAQSTNAQLQSGQEALAEALAGALRDAEASGARVLGEARVEEVQVAQGTQDEMALRLSAAYEELRQRERDRADYTHNLGRLEAGLEGAVGAIERSRELNERLRCEVDESAGCIRELRRENGALSQELGVERHERAAHLEPASRPRAVGLDAVAREQRLEGEGASAADQLRGMAEPRMGEASQQAVVRELQGALEQQRLLEASALARVAELERSTEQQLLEASQHVREHESHRLRIEELERELEVMLQERVELRKQEASSREYQRHLEDALAEHACVARDLQCELDQRTEHSVLQQTRVKDPEAIPTQYTSDVPQQAPAGNPERDLERKGAVQQERLMELEAASARQIQQNHVHLTRIGALELELERLRPQEPSARARALGREGAGAEQGLRGTPQGASLQDLRHELEQAQQELRQAARARELDEERQARAGELELELQRLRQQEASLRATIWQLEGAASQQSLRDASQQALAHDLQQRELAQQARLRELGGAADQGRWEDATRQPREEELERLLERALRRERAQQARSAQLEEELRESTRPQPLQQEERLAELEQELTDTRGMHHWQRARHREHVADLERELAESRRGRALAEASGGLERRLEMEVAAARAELEVRLQRQLRQLHRAQELQRAGLRRGHAAQAQVDALERLLRELEIGLPRESPAAAPAALAAAAAAQGVSAQQMVTVVEAPARVQEPVLRLVAPLPSVASPVRRASAALSPGSSASVVSSAVVSPGAPPMGLLASPLRWIGQ
ncbi:unnamed protein product [Prorocentrum cordatum]|uniref:Uncharacterized protein n=1 Tax=Prorocentrum cordatum TaxID=2364126 RepID=A0ABN9US51_9DINO|nr:unnamed protein product [Polarella glacialis]